MTKFKNGVETTTLKVTSGTPAQSEVLTSDATGVATWQPPPWLFQNFVIGGEVKVPSGQTDAIPPMYVSVRPGTTLKLARVRYRIGGGTNVGFKLQKNGSDITGFTGLTATTTAAETDPTDVALADNDAIQIVVTSVTATPVNFTVTLTFETGV